MNNKLVVVADLGSFKAYKLEANNLHSTPRLELTEEINLMDASGRTLERTNESSSREHAPVMGKWATPWGERHNIELERKRRLVKQLANALTALLRRDSADGCYLAASKEISHQILAELPREARARIEKIVASDLTKAEKVDLLRHFEVGKQKPGETAILANQQMRRGANFRLQA
jgi:hypothetical protein